MPERLSDRLSEDLKIAMRSGDQLRRDVIRYLRASFKNSEIEAGRPLTEEESVEVVQSQIKQRRDSIDAFKQAGRTDLVEKEEAQLAVLIEYLPDDLRPMSEAELEALVVETANALNLSEPGDMRTLMPALIEKTGGRADNRLLSRLAGNELQRRSSR